MHSMEVKDAHGTKKGFKGIWLINNFSFYYSRAKISRHNCFTNADHDLISDKMKKTILKVNKIYQQNAKFFT